MIIYSRPRKTRTEDRYYFVHRRSGKLIGVISTSRLVPYAFVSIYFNRFYQGRGYGSEAYQVILPLIMTCLEFERLVAVINSGNLRSIRFHTKHGFRLDPITKLWSRPHVQE